MALTFLPRHGRFGGEIDAGCDGFAIGAGVFPVRIDHDCPRQVIETLGAHVWPVLGQMLLLHAGPRQPVFVQWPERA